MLDLNEYSRNLLKKIAKISKSEVSRPMFVEQDAGNLTISYWIADENNNPVRKYYKPTPTSDEVVKSEVVENILILKDLGLIRIEDNLNRSNITLTYKGSLLADNLEEDLYYKLQPEDVSSTTNNPIIDDLAEKDEIEEDEIDSNPLIDLVKRVFAWTIDFLTRIFQ